MALTSCARAKRGTIRHFFRRSKGRFPLVIIILVLVGVHRIQGPQDGHDGHDERQDAALLEAQQDSPSGQHPQDTL